MKVPTQHTDKEITEFIENSIANDIEYIDKICTQLVQIHGGKNADYLLVATIISLTKSVDDLKGYINNLM